MKKTFILLAGITLLTACSSNNQPRPMAEKPINVSQLNDNQLNCTQLDTKTRSLEAKAKQVVKQKQQQDKQSFTTQSAINMILALFSSSATANNRVLSNYSDVKKQQINGLTQRHHHLMNLAKQKHCRFVPVAEKRLNDYLKTQNKHPSNTNYHRRVTN